MTILDSGRESVALLLAVSLLFLPGCGLATDSGDQDEVSAIQSSRTDPQVLGDVVDSVFLVPGNEQLRTIRVSNFTRALMFKGCGGEGPPLDSTADRFMQQLFPDLDLIRERGLVESQPTVDADPPAANCDAGSSGLDRKLPSREAAFNLIQPWLDLVETALQDPTLTSLKEPMWECMTEKSGLEVGQDVPADFLKAVNLALSASGPTDLTVLSEIYADCSGAYFDRLRGMLLDQRPAMVERNRELLERYATELVAAGYVP